MSFKHFYSKYKAEENLEIANILPSDIEGINSDFEDCINELGGKTFNRGIYRVYSGDKINEATDIMRRVFPEFRDRIICFSYDWLGRHFAIDLSRTESGSPLILLLEPGAGEALEIPAPIVEFHNDILINLADDALAIPFYEQWLEVQNITIQPFECVGYKTPLFLGGSDTIDNLELIDMDVYLEICGQLRNKIKELPNGTTIRDIIIE